MSNNYLLPGGSIGRFAVVKLWPGIRTAEDECIARLKIAAESLGAECIEILADGSLLAEPQIKISRDIVDFVIHLHYDTPKNYDAFSFVALWNPLTFYLEWGYRRTSRNLTTHDDFLSCGSNAANHHVARLIRHAQTHLPAQISLYHSPPEVVHSPSLGDGKLFYVGINWETITGGQARHQEVLKLLDKTGLLRIFGPHIFQGVKVWDGYDSYVREIPFDGISLINEISKAGISLVFSSQPHKDAAIMSNRLFESVAAGALVICDENPFARNFFGDSLLYIDSRLTAEEIVADITRHLEWALKNPDLALAMIAKSQDIFSKKFSLTQNLVDLYNVLEERKTTLLAKQNPPNSPRVNIRLYLLMPEYSMAVLRTHIDSVRVQSYDDISPAIVVDRRVARLARSEIERVLASSPIKIELFEVDFFNDSDSPAVKTRRRLGQIIQLLVDDAMGNDAFIVVAPNERIFSNHVAVLAGALQRSPNVHCAATAAIHHDGVSPIHTVGDLIDFGHVDKKGPPGLGRFIFRRSSIPKDIDIALPYLDGRPLAALVGDHEIEQQLAASIIIDIQQEFPDRTWNDAAENEIIRDFCPGAFKLRTGFGPTPGANTAISMPTSEQPAPSPPVQPPMTTLQLISRLLSPRAYAAQIKAIRDHGFQARIIAFKRRLGI